ncbi:AMIN-like domain-containing (lipo)protein [Actinokineospora sp.]|uniref:AMIN-like domain-containing (lipo)protein n=1 Tax=Actinokineospora sp. TaxID=1872133 RepID=UPI004037BFDA
MVQRRTWGRSLIAAVGLAAAVAVAVPSSATATPGYCGIAWGSLAKSASPTEVSTLVDVRAGRHDCYDRLVVDISAGGADGYRVEYVGQVSEDGSGNVVPLRGGAKLRVVVIAPAYNDLGALTYNPVNRAELVNVAGWQTFRQVAWAGSFEGQSTVGLGVRARLPFRAFVLDGPAGGSRLVVDVAHFW